MPASSPLSSNHPVPVTIRKTRWQDDEAALRSIREAVFIREQGVPEALEWDDQDEAAIHFLAMTAQDEAVGCIRLLPTGQLSRLAVLERCRNQDIGSALLAAAEQEAREQGMKEVFLHAQTQATNFYEQAGFTVSGGIFLEANIPHRQMFKELAR